MDFPSNATAPEIEEQNIWHTGYHHMMYEAMLSMMVNFTNDSHVNSGFCLVHCCGQHVLDAKAQDIAKTTAHLFHSMDDRSEIGIHSRINVPPSMKKEAYTVNVICTNSKLIACECECMSGGKKRKSDMCSLLTCYYEAFIAAH
eukprot:9591008-Ditylum_brightwellii.AAC.1